MTDAQKRYRMRFRFRTSKPFESQEMSRQFSFGDVIVRLAAAGGERPFLNEHWLVMEAGEFSSEVHARDFGQKLRSAVEYASLEAKVGIDCGDDVATSGFGRVLVAKVKDETGKDVVPLVHGIAVLAEDVDPLYLTISGHLTVATSLERFVDLVEGAPTDNFSDELRHATALVNLAYSDVDDMAKIVLSVSAVELLGQKADWNKAQDAVLRGFVATVEQSTLVGPDLDDLRDAIQNQLFPKSLGRGVRDLLSRLGLLHLKKNWDRMYNNRSRLVHGKQRFSRQDVQRLAHEARDLAHTIVKCAQLTDEAP